MAKTDPRTGIPILSRREMMKLSLGDLAEYNMRVMHARPRSPALQTAMEDSLAMMLKKQEQLRDARDTPRYERQPRPGYIYLVEGDRSYKIGKATNVPNRLRSFLQLPFRTRLIHTIPTIDMAWAEAFLHRQFAHCRLNGEWFDLAPGEVDWVCRIGSLDPQ